MNRVKIIKLNSEGNKMTLSESDENREYEFSVQHKPFNTPFLVVLNCLLLSVQPAMNSKLDLVLLVDSMSKEDWRHLRVALHTGNYKSIHASSSVERKQ